MSTIQRPCQTTTRIIGKISIDNEIEIQRLLNAIKQSNLAKIVNSLWALKIEGIQQPTLEQIATSGGIGIATIKRYSQLVQRLHTIYDLISNDTKIMRHMGVDPSVPLSSIILDESLLSALSLEGVSLSGSAFMLTYDESVVELPTTKTYLQPIEKVCVGLALPLDTYNLKLHCDSMSIKKYLYALTTIALREEKVFHANTSSWNQKAFGEHYFNFYNNVVSGNGRVWWKSRSRRWFYNYDNSKSINKLLEKDSSYKVSEYSMAFKPTKLGHKVISKAIEYFKILEFVPNSVVYNPSEHIILRRELLEEISFQDLVLLLNNVIGLNDDGFIVELNALDTLTDRVYSLFTSISSETRIKLGYINYDIGAALQTIVLKLVPDEIRQLCPLHQELVDDKHTFRGKVMQETGKSLPWVKKELSKLDNMDSYNTTSETLQEYFIEAEFIRYELLEHICNSEPTVYRTAYYKAKNILTKEWSQEHSEYKFVPTSKKKEASVFFFVWTQYERFIREAMKAPFTNKSEVIDVHDAVYSKEKVDISLLEQSVLENTGFEVKISH